MNEIDWENGDLDDILGIKDIDKEEDFHIDEIEKKEDIVYGYSNSISKILDGLSGLDFEDMIEYLESKLNIKIKTSTASGGNIELYTVDGDLIGKIWSDSFIVDDGYIENLHLGIEVYGEYQGRKYSNLLYELFRKFSDSDEDIIFPEYDYAKQTSRISLLLNQGYSLTHKYINGVFVETDDIDIQKIKDDIKNDYHGKQNTVYKFSLLD